MILWGLLQLFARGQPDNCACGNWRSQRTGPPVRFVSLWSWGQDWPLRGQHVCV